MRRLFFDTETTGLPKWNLPPTDENQPNLVQLAAILFDEDNFELASINLIIQPQDWTVPDVAANIHKITTEKAHTWGVGLDNAVHMFTDLVDIADETIAHNMRFDSLIMKRAGAIVGLPDGMFECKKMSCTMLSSMNILKIKQARGRDYKWPRLEECYKYFFREKLTGAHDALVDVRACARVYFELQKMGAV